MNAIRITCQGASALPYHELEPFQGNLKSLSEANYQKLRQEILELGFFDPILVWRAQTDDGPKNFIISGHQRQRVVKRMVEEEGFECPDLPINPIEADSWQEAKKKILAAISQYGKLEDQGLYEFMSDAGLTFQEVQASFDLPALDMDKFGEEYYDVEPPAKPEKEKDEPATKDPEEPQHLVVVSCDGESSQQELFQELTGRGYTCKVTG